MSDQRPVIYNSGIGDLNILGIIFVLLKVCGEQFPTPVANWSWWLVTLPFWFWLGITGVALIVAGIGAAIMFLVCGFWGFCQRMLRKARDRKREQFWQKVDYRVRERARAHEQKAENPDRHV